MGLTLTILLATLSLARWSFSQGFLNYFDAVEVRRLEYISQDMVEKYNAVGRDWANLPAGAFYEVLQEYSTLDELSLPPGPAGGPPGSRDGRPSREGDVPPGRDGSGRAPESAYVPNMPPPFREIPPDFAPTRLVDADGSFISGIEFDPDAEKVLEVVMVSEGVLIGRIQAMSPDRLDFDLAQEFARQQLWTSLLIGLFCLALAVTLALSLSSLFLNPVRKIIKAVSSMSDGDYSVRLNENRRDEFGKMMRNIDHLGKTLEQNRATKNRWLADVSHELRTPLTILSGELEMLQEGLKPFDQTQLESLQQEVDRMNHLVNDLYQLSLSEIGGLRYNFEQVDIEECIMSAASACQTKVSEKGLMLDVSCEGSCLVHADHKRLEQLFLNLLINSAAYTDAPGQVRVNVQSEGSHVTINVDDTKPSVSQQECDLLLEALYRTDMSRTRRGEGAGLGLTICKNIVEAHGGEITLTPSELGGLNVRIKLKTEDKKL